MLRPRAMRYISAPSHGTKTSRITQPAFAQPLSELSLNRSNRQRNQTISAAIQMKNQKLHSRTSPKSVVIASITTPVSISVLHRRTTGVPRSESTGGPAISSSAPDDLCSGVLVAAAPGERVDLERRSGGDAHPGADGTAEPFEHLPLVEVRPAEPLDVGAVRRERGDAEVERVGGVDAVPGLGGAGGPHLPHAVPLLEPAG